MPAAKNAARKATKRTAKKATKRSAQRTLSAAHKRALAEGRTMSATVDRYLSAVNTPKQRGRKVSKATLTQRLAAARERAKSATGVEKVLAAQEVRDLQNKLATLNAASGTDVKSLEAAKTREDLERIRAAQPAPPTAMAAAFERASGGGEPNADE